MLEAAEKLWKLNQVNILFICRSYVCIMYRITENLVSTQYFNLRRVFMPGMNLNQINKMIIYFL